MRVAVVGAGWAGLAAAVRATQAGHQVTVFEMAPQLGGRARAVHLDGLDLDNGQHILIGAYLRTLALMDTVGVDIDNSLMRLSLAIRYPDGQGLVLPAGPAWLVFGWAVLRAQGWGWRDKWALMTTALRWAGSGFRCSDHATVDQLCAKLPKPVRLLLIDPLCVAALNTAATEASGQVFLRVLRDALFSGVGSADLLLPRRNLSALMPDLAAAWLADHKTPIRLNTRVDRLAACGSGWLVNGEAFDTVVIAASAAEAARLCAPHAPLWAAAAADFGYEPIITVYVSSEGSKLGQPMTALVEGPQSPAQFVFDHGALGTHSGVFAFVVSGARTWVERGLSATGEAVLAQALAQFPSGTWTSPPRVLRVLSEKRATFRCVPGLSRPCTAIASNLLAAGDYVEGPYPATLEGAVRSGERAIAMIGRER